MAGLCAVLIGCPSPSESLITASELVGARTARGGEAWIDAEAAFKIRIHGACKACVITLEQPVSCAASERTDGSLLECSIDAAQPRGLATLRLTDSGSPVNEWTVRVGSGPKAASSNGGVTERLLWGSLDAARAGGTAQAWVESAGFAGALGFPSEQARRLHSAVWFSLYTGALSEAEGLIEHAAKLGGTSPTTRADDGYYRGLLAWMVGDYRGALRSWEKATELALDIGDLRRVAMTREAMASTALPDLGRHAEALAMLHALRPWVEQTGDLQARARLASNLGWAELQTATSTRTASAFDAAKRALEDALVVVDAPGARGRLASVNLNLAWTHLRAGDPVVQAAAALAKAREAHRRYGGLLQPEYLALIAGEVALAQRDAPAAQHAFDSLSADAPIDVRWRAHYGRGRAALLAGDPAAARVSMLAGLGALDAMARNLAARSGRGQFLGQRRALLADTLDLLLAEGDVETAFSVADRTQARLLRALTAQARVPRLPAEARAGWFEQVARWRGANDAWQAKLRAAGPFTSDERAAHERAVSTARKAADDAFEAALAWLDEHSPEMTPPGSDVADVRAALGDGDALIEYLPHREGWLVFIIDADGVRSRQVQGEAVPRWPEVAGHLHVVSGGRLDVYDRAPPGLSVGYLPHAGFLTAGQPTGRGSLVAVDPSNDLPSARGDTKHVPGADQGKVQALIGRAVKREEVLAGLQTVGLFHFSGHGVLRPDDPWGAYLRLGDGRLTLDDVLTLKLPGNLIVLSGCRTGVTDVLARSDVVGLPEAFLAAGARTVVAADRDVPDAEASRFVEVFYGSGGVEKPAEALKVANAVLAREGLGSAHAWRIIGF